MIRREEWDRFYLPVLTYDSYLLSQWLIDEEAGTTLRCSIALIITSIEAKIAERFFETNVPARVHVMSSCYFDWINESVENLLFMESLVQHLHHRLNRKEINIRHNFYELYPDPVHMTTLPDSGVYRDTYRGTWRTVRRPWWAGRS